MGMNQGRSSDAAAQDRGAGGPSWSGRVELGQNKLSLMLDVQSAGWPSSQSS